MRRTWQRTFVRGVAVLACAVALAGLGATLYVYREVDRAERATREQLRQLGTSVGRVAATLETVGAAAGRAGDTAGEAERAVAQAATATDGTAVALTRIADRVNATPGVAVDVGDQAEQLRGLADQLERTSDALNRNEADLRALGTDVARIARDMDDIAGQLRRFAGDGDGTSELARLTDTARLTIAAGVGLLLVLLFGLGAALYVMTTDAWRA